MQRQKAAVMSLRLIIRCMIGAAALPGHATSPQTLERWALTELRCDDRSQAEGALTAQKQAEADAAAAAKAHESTLASEKEHYSGLLQRARAAQVGWWQNQGGREQAVGSQQSSAAVAVGLDCMPAIVESSQLA